MGKEDRNKKNARNRAYEQRHKQVCECGNVMRRTSKHCKECSDRILGAKLGRLTQERVMNGEDPRTPMQKGSG